MVVRDFQDLLTSQPFQPFRIVMSSGESYEVRHPEMAWLTRTTLFVGIDEDSEGIPGRAKMCSLLHITVVEALPAGAKKRRNR
jgi:hypothetical protein